MSDIGNNVSAEVPILTQKDIQTLFDMFGSNLPPPQSKCTFVHQNIQLLHPAEILGPQYPMSEHWNIVPLPEDDDDELKCH
jgi:hypothetical protein